LMNQNTDNCIDTLAIINCENKTLHFSPYSFFKKIEFGYISNKIMQSERISDPFGEDYNLTSSNGYLIGIEFLEVRAPAELGQAGISLGITYRNYELEGTYRQEESGVKSASEVLLELRFELPFLFIQKDLKNLSFRGYFSLSDQFSLYGKINSTSNKNILNDQLKANSELGCGLNWNFYKDYGIESRIMFSNYNSMPTKISFTTSRIEVLVYYLLGDLNGYFR